MRPEQAGHTEGTTGTCDVKATTTEELGFEGRITSYNVCYTKLLRKFYAGGTAIIATGTAIFFGLTASAFLPSYIGALYLRKTSRQAAIACFATGVVSTLFWLFFVHAKEAIPLGLCKLVFGKSTLFPALANVDAVIVALPLSFIVYSYNFV